MNTSIRKKITSCFIALIICSHGCREEDPAEVVLFEDMTYIGSDSQREADAITYEQYYPGMDRAALAREYFVEMFLATSISGKNRHKTVRAVETPPFIFDVINTSDPLANLARDLIPPLVQRMTGGVLVGQTIGFTDEAPDGPKYSFKMTSGDSAFCSARSRRVNVGGIDRVVTGDIQCDRGYYGTSASRGSRFIGLALLHELGHVLGHAMHSGMVGTVMSYNNIRQLPAYVFPQFDQSLPSLCVL